MFRSIADMQTLADLLHVGLAVFVVGPAVLAPWAGVRGLARGDAAGIRSAGKLTLLFNTATLAVFAAGLLSVAVSDEYDFGTVWVVVATTLYIVAAVVGIGVLPATLARVASKSDPDLDPTTPPDAAVQRFRGRLSAMAALLGILYLVIVILMVVKPFS